MWLRLLIVLILRLSNLDQHDVVAAEINEFKCEINKGSLGVTPHRHRWRNSATNASHTWVMLLGVAYSGTSAAHFLLENNNPNVSVLKHSGILNSQKEGWTMIMSNESRVKELRGKSLKSVAAGNRWNPKKLQIQLGNPWSDVVRTYMQKWNLSQKYLLENSPPEILYYREIIKEFRAMQKKGNEMRMAVVLLTRNPCNSKDPNFSAWMYHYFAILKDIEAHGGDVFLLRYEDICGTARQKKQLNIDLEKFLPDFGQLDFDAIPSPGHRHTNSTQRALADTITHAHLYKSVSAYCKSHFFPEIPYHSYTAATISNPDSMAVNSSIEGWQSYLFKHYGNSTVKDYAQILRYLGY
jgi:hypothetical protein